MTYEPDQLHGPDLLHDPITAPRYSGLTQDPNPDATVPTGMCGSPKVCAECPSHFLCWMKAKDEMEIIREREKGGGQSQGAESVV